MGNRLRRLLADETGEDLIEYLLLASFLATAGYLGMEILGNAMDSSYRSWDSTTQEVWEVKNPVP